MDHEELDAFTGDPAQTVTQTIGAAQKEAVASKISDLLALVDQLPDSPVTDGLQGVLERLSGEVAAPPETDFDTCGDCTNDGGGWRVEGGCLRRR